MKLNNQLLKNYLTTFSLKKTNKVNQFKSCLFNKLAISFKTRGIFHTTKYPNSDNLQISLNSRCCQVNKIQFADLTNLKINKIITSQYLPLQSKTIAQKLEYIKAIFIFLSTPNLTQNFFSQRLLTIDINNFPSQNILILLKVLPPF